MKKISFICLLIFMGCSPYYQMNTKLIREIRPVGSPEWPNAGVYYRDDGESIIEISDPKLTCSKFNIYAIDSIGDTSLLYVIPKMVSHGLKGSTYSFLGIKDLNKRIDYKIVAYFEPDYNLGIKEIRIRKYQSNAK
jgi:hypothetical protein